MLAEHRGWGAVAPAMRADGNRGPAKLRMLLVASLLSVAMVVLALIQEREGQRTALSIDGGLNGALGQASSQSLRFVKPNGEPACSKCMEHILEANKPWTTSHLDAEYALSCASEGACAAQVLASTAHPYPTGRTMSLAARESAALAPSKEQLAYDGKQLDKQQLELNWKRARVFAQYFGPPKPQKQDLVLTNWVVPLDLHGRPVPSWLSFQPQTDLQAVATPQLASGVVMMSPPRNASGTGTESSMMSRLDQEEAKNAIEMKNLVELSKHTAGYALLEGDKILRANLRAVDVFPIGDKTGKSLAAALAPLNQEQMNINERRQMLSFRMETGTPIGGGEQSFEAIARPTTTWSTLGRPMAGWLHWGMDNDGGYFNPTGGTYWDPHVVNPAAAKGTDGPATNEWKKEHPFAEQEGAAEMGMGDLAGGEEATQAGSGLFGA
jgi:hypothetical protein